MPRALIARAAGRDAARRQSTQVSRCQGFRVWTPRGKLGVVEEVVLDEWGEPRELVVRRGLIRIRRIRLSARVVSLVDMKRRSVFADGWAGGAPAGGRMSGREILDA